MESVHELRLSIKRLRALNKLVDQFCLSDTDEHIHIKHRVRQLYKLAGQLRDTQVQLHMLALFEEKTGTEYIEFSKWLLRRKKKKIARFTSKPRHVVPHATARVTHDKIGNKLALSTDETILQSAGIVLKELFSKAQKLAGGDITERNLHRIRIITKQIRYISNIMHQSYPDYKSDALSDESMREIEFASGNWHDSLVRVELLNKFLDSMQSEDNTTMLKYKKLSYICTAELDIAYQEACRVVRKEILR